MNFAANIGRILINGPKRIPNLDEMQALIAFTRLSVEAPHIQTEFYHAVSKQSPAHEILLHRFRHHFGDQQPFSPTLLLWLATLADRPGDVVLLVAVLAHMKAEGRDLTLSHLMGHYFEMGIPTREAYDIAWLAQKVTPERLKHCAITKAHSDNMLDHQEAWHENNLEREASIR